MYEVYFYAIFAGALFLRAQLGTILIATTAIGLMLAIGNLMAEKHAFLSDPIVLEFCFGMFLAYAFSHYQLPVSVVHFGWLLGFAMLCLAPLYVTHDTTNGLPSSVRWAAWGFPATIVVVSFLGFARVLSTTLPEWVVT